ncbi:MAG: TolC family protein [Bryobacteraceae bacterium]
MRLRWIVLALGLVPAWGQRTSPILDPVSGKTADDLVALALTQNGELLAGRELVKAAYGNITQAGLKANPSLDSSESRQLTGSMSTFMVGASLPLELYHRRERRVEVAQGVAVATGAEQANRERLLRGEVEAKFGAVLASIRNLQVVEELLDLNRKALELTQTRADQGATPPLDANLLRVEVNRIDAQRVEMEAKAGIDLLELKSLLGMRPDEDLRLKGSLDLVPEGRGLESSLEVRPDLVSIRAGENVAAARLRQAETEARPDVKVSANYQRSNSSFDLNGLNAAGQVRPIQGVFHFLAVGVSITLPVRNKNQGAIEVAVAQVQESKRRREYSELTAAREVAVALLARDKAQEGLKIYRDGVRGQASQNLEVIRRTYELGRTQLLDVIAEQRRFIDIEMGYTDALTRLYQATVRLRTVTGGW